MSLITQCPACGTLFKVVADQLKISEGWVRCGQCVEVFDAQAHMASPQGALVPPPPSAPLTPSAVTEPTRNDQDIDLPLPTNEATQAKKNPDLTQSEPALVAPPSPVISPVPAPSKIKPAPAPAISEEADDTPGFVRQAQRAQRWQSPWARAGLGVIALMLGIVLSLQVARQERDRIAAAEPRLLPWLQKLCSAADCTVGPLKQIEAVVVEASSFNKLRTDGKYELYRLVLNLKNTSPLSVAVPHIELSLNDVQDQAILRRVLSPADLASSQAVLAPITEFSANTTIQIDSSLLAGARIAGYRVWAFYP